MIIETWHDDGWYFTKINSKVYRGSLGNLGYDYKRKLCKMLNTTDDNGMIGKWKVQEEYKKFNDYKTLHDTIHMYKERMCQLLQISKRSNFDQIIDKIKELKKNSIND